MCQIWGVLLLPSTRPRPIDHSIDHSRKVALIKTRVRAPPREGGTKAAPMPRKLDVRAISSVLLERIEKEFEAAHANAIGTPMAMPSWLALTKDDKKLEDAAQRIWYEIFPKKTEDKRGWEIAQNCKDRRLFALRGWVAGKQGKSSTSTMEVLEQIDKLVTREVAVNQPNSMQPSSS